MTLTPITLHRQTVFADPAGVLLWPDHALLAVTDLHLEKGSFCAGRGRLMPPYDSRQTLERLKAALHRHRPRRVVCLGDSFHDRDGADRLSAADRDTLHSMVTAHDWIWITGNHDPTPPRRLGGHGVATLEMGGLIFRHEAKGMTHGEISGHFHPVAVVRTPRMRFRGPCFVTDERRLILPAFGTYTGGLNVLSPSVRRLLANRFSVHVLARQRLFTFPGHVLRPDVAS